MHRLLGHFFRLPSSAVVFTRRVASSVVKESAGFPDGDERKQSEHQHHEVEKSSYAHTDTSFAACVKRDAILRPFLCGVYWNKGPEFALVRNLLFRPHPSDWAAFAEKYPLLFDHEWVIPVNSGIFYVGDLLFTDGFNHFLVVEVKSLESSVFAKSSSGKTARGQRTHRRKLTKKQGKQFASLWHEMNPQVLTTEAVAVIGGALRNIVCFSREPQ